MPDEEWIKKLDDGRKVKFIYQELPEDGAFITAQIERNEVVYSVVLTKAGNPLSREDVEVISGASSQRSSTTIRGAPRLLLPIPAAYRAVRRD
jgi:hypothetical protein